MLHRRQCERSLAVGPGRGRAFQKNLGVGDPNRSQIARLAVTTCSRHASPRPRTLSRSIESIAYGIRRERSARGWVNLGTCGATWPPPKTAKQTSNSACKLTNDQDTRHSKRRHDDERRHRMKHSKQR